MTERNIKSVRGWCPGALKPMESGDGLIVRLRAHAGTLSADDLLAIAGIAQRFGNGLIDLTRRANVQIRGVTQDKLAGLWSDLSMLGLLDPSSEAEAVRNVMVNPLAGVDPTEICDVRGLARELERHLVEDQTLWQLPGKFGFIVDGRGLLSLDDERADIRLKAVRVDEETKVALGIDGPEGTTWLGAADLQTAADAAVCVGHAFLDVRGSDVRSRMRDLPETARLQIHAAVATQLALIEQIPLGGETRPRLGTLDYNGSVFAAGIAAPFGRIEAETLRTLAALSIKLGVRQFRLSPWRCFYTTVSDEQTAKTLLAAAQAHSLIIDTADPLLAIDACPGAPACRSTTLDTRAAARRLAPLLNELGCRCVHISGCAKGCARSKPADLVLVGAGDRFGIIHHDTARAEPRDFVAPAHITQLPPLIRTS